MSAPGALTFSWGRGRHGVLGTGNEEDDTPVASPRHLGGPLAGRRIAQVCCGECHTLALTAEAGAVFSWGSGLMGALGHGGRANELTPRRIESVPFATQLVAGKHHSAALCPDGGGVLAWGWDGWEGSTCIKTPQRVSHLSAGSGVQLAAGACHLAVLTRSDGVVSSGGGVVQAGVLRDAGVVSIAAGTRHTAALASDATVYTWAHGAVGAAEAGPTGRPYQAPPHLQPMRCAWLGGALCIACGGDYTLALLPTSDGTRVVRWQHVNAPDGATPTASAQDERDAGEVRAPHAEGLVAGGGYALVIQADGSALCISPHAPSRKAGGSGGGGGGGVGGFGGLPLGLAPPLANPGEPLRLPSGPNARIAAIALGDFHAVACVVLPGANSDPSLPGVGGSPAGYARARPALLSTASLHQKAVAAPPPPSQQQQQQQQQQQRTPHAPSTLVGADPLTPYHAADDAHAAYARDYAAAHAAAVTPSRKLEMYATAVTREGFSSLPGGATVGRSPDAAYGTGHVQPWGAHPDARLSFYTEQLAVTSGPPPPSASAFASGHTTSREPEPRPTWDMAPPPSRRDGGHCAVGEGAHAGDKSASPFGTTSQPAYLHNYPPEQVSATPYSHAPMPHSAQPRAPDEPPTLHLADPPPPLYSNQLTAYDARASEHAETMAQRQMDAMQSDRQAEAAVASRFAPGGGGVRSNAPPHQQSQQQPQQQPHQPHSTATTPAHRPGHPGGGGATPYSAAKSPTEALWMRE